MMEIEFDTHKQLHNLVYINGISSYRFCNAIVFYPEVYIRKLTIVALIQIAQFDPFVYQIKWDILVLFLICFYSFHIENSSRFVHHFTI